MGQGNPRRDPGDLPVESQKEFYGEDEDADDPVEFSIRVEQGHRRYTAWVEGDKEATVVSAPSAYRAVSRLTEEQISNSHAGPLPTEEG